jgi:hypothetical protein
MENTYSDGIVEKENLPSYLLAMEVYYAGTDHIENTSTVFLTACVGLFTELLPSNALIRHNILFFETRRS